MGLETLAIAAITASAVGTGVSAYSSAQAGRSQQTLSDYNAQITQQAADYNADVITKTADYNAELTTSTADANAARVVKAADYNARVNELNANSSLIDSATMASIQRLNNEHTLATQRARFGASGVVAGTGSPLMVEAAQAGYAEMAALQTEHSGQVRSQAFLQEAATERWNAGEDATAIKTNALNESAAMKWTADNQAAMTRFTGSSQATLDVMGGSAARSAGNLAAVGTILQGAGKAYSSYKGFGGT